VLFDAELVHSLTAAVCCVTVQLLRQNNVLLILDNEANSTATKTITPRANDETLRLTDTAT